MAAANGRSLLLRAVGDGVAPFASLWGSNDGSATLNPLVMITARGGWVGAGVAGAGVAQWSPGVASCVYVSPPRGSAVGSGAFFWPELQREMVGEVGTRNEQLALDEVVVYEVARLTPASTDGRKEGGRL